ncbi:MAG: ATP-binding protein, partial [Myxococcota bacterium]|nr:ATP-binding protein [Myxococcota bacterium]
MEQHSFQADAKQILRLVTHSIYSEREVFLRELLSNASDALDKARILSLKGDDIVAVEEPAIRVHFNEENSVIVIEDDGIGMTEDELVENLGTIAQSGTKAFAEKLESASDMESLIGQFGVGFYSAFMVADKVEVETLSAKSNEKPLCWISEGGDSYSIGEGSKETRGTTIKLHIRE